MTPYFGYWGCSCKKKAVAHRQPVNRLSGLLLLFRLFLAVLLAVGTLLFAGLSGFFANWLVPAFKPVEDGHQAVGILAFQPADELGVVIAMADGDIVYHLRAVIGKKSVVLPAVDP